VVDADIGLAVSDKHGGHPAGNMEKSGNRKWYVTMYNVMVIN